MNFIIKTTPDEVNRARKWWQDLEVQWKMAYNEAVFLKGPVMEPPKDEEMMMLLIGADTLRFAGPLASNPNISTKLTNLSGLIPLYQLKYLSVSHTKITSLLPLMRFSQMEHLFVYNNELTSLDGIQNMLNLKDLYCQENKITSLKPLKLLTNLHTAYVSGNRLESLKGITKKHAKNLKKLYVLPNEDLPHKELIRIQNKVGILYSKG